MFFSNLTIHPRTVHISTFYLVRVIKKSYDNIWYQSNYLLSPINNWLFFNYCCFPYFGSVCQLPDLYHVVLVDFLHGTWMFWEDFSLRICWLFFYLPFVPLLCQLGCSFYLWWFFYVKYPRRFDLETVPEPIRSCLSFETERALNRMKNWIQIDRASCSEFAFWFMSFWSKHGGFWYDWKTTWLDSVATCL